MKRKLILVAVVLAGLMGVAHAQVVPVTEPAKPMAKAAAKALTALCDGCRTVTSVTTEKRKGKATGVGAVGGAVAGGVVGNKVGGGTLGTVGGAAVGGVVGNELEKQFKRHKVWVVTTQTKDGSTNKHEFESDPQLKAGDVVVPDGAGLKRR